MTTIKATGPLLYSVKTDTQAGVPQGKVYVACVRYETYEIAEADFNAMTFKVHDAASEEARAIAKLVNSP